MIFWLYISMKRLKPRVCTKSFRFSAGFVRKIGGKTKKKRGERRSKEKKFGGAETWTKPASIICRRGKKKMWFCLFLQWSKTELSMKTWLFYFRLIWYFSVFELWREIIYLFSIWSSSKIITRQWHWIYLPSTQHRTLIMRLEEKSKPNSQTQL